MRSIMHSLPEEDIAGLHLVTTDLPIGNETRIRAGQVPSWLSSQQSCSTHLTLHHHWDLFKLRPTPNHELDSRIWRANALPSFNSIGIESQMVSLVPELTDTILYVRTLFTLIDIRS